MTDKVKSSLGRASTALGIIIILVSFVAYMTRALDASTQAFIGVKELRAIVRQKTSGRTKADAVLSEAIVTERPEMEVVLDEQQHIYIPKELAI